MDTLKIFHQTRLLLRECFPYIFPFCVVERTVSSLGDYVIFTPDQLGLSVLYACATLPISMVISLIILEIIFLQQHNSLSVKKLCRGVISKFFPFLIATIVAGLKVVAFFLLLVVPGIIQGLKLALVAPLVIFEPQCQKEPLRALRISGDLTLGYKWPCLGVITCLVIIALTLPILMEFLNWTPLAKLLTDSFVVGILEAYFFTFLISFYLHRAQPEGVVRAIPSQPMSKRILLKRVIWGFTGIVGILALTLLILNWKFSPLLSIDKENGRVILLGGMLDIDEKGGTLKFKIKSTAIRYDFQEDTFDGESEGDPSREIHILFHSVVMKLMPANDNHMRWHCKVDEGKTSKSRGSFKMKEKIFMLNLKELNHANCKIELPPASKIVIKGNHGKLNIVNPQEEMSIVLDDGEVKIKPDSKKTYKYDAKVTDGYVEGLTSSETQGAIPIQIDITHGTIKRVN